MFVPEFHKRRKDKNSMLMLTEKSFSRMIFTL